MKHISLSIAILLSGSMAYLEIDFTSDPSLAHQLAICAVGAGLVFLFWMGATLQAIPQMQKAGWVVFGLSICVALAISYYGELLHQEGGMQQYKRLLFHLLNFTRACAEITFSLSILGERKNDENVRKSEEQNRNKKLTELIKERNDEIKNLNDQLKETKDKNEKLSRAIVSQNELREKHQNEKHAIVAKNEKLYAEIAEKSTKLNDLQGNLQGLTNMYFPAGKTQRWVICPSCSAPNLLSNAQKSPYTCSTCGAANPVPTKKTE